MRRRSDVATKGHEEPTKMDDRSSMSAVEGERVSYTWGAETVQAVQFNSCSVGPFSVEVIVQQFETYEQAFDRARAACERMAQHEFQRKVQEHLAHIEEAQQITRDRARGRR